MPLENWSTTAASNDTADATVNWQEGQLPSTVNNSARAMMAAVAAWLKTVGAYGTVGGTADAITLTTDQAPSALGPAIVGFIATADNTGAVTLNRDSLGAKPLRAVSGSALAAGQIATGCFYLAAYTTASSGQWIIVNSGVLKTYVDAQDTAAIASAASAAAALYVPLTRTLTAGNKISGGGTLAADRTFDLDTTAVTPGSYTRATITVDAYGTLTAAANGASELPTQTSKATYTLTTDGSSASWTSNNTVSAAAACINLATTPALDTGSVNASACSVPSTGKVRLTFTNALTTKYRVHAMTDTVGINGYFTAKTTGYVEIQFYNTATGNPQLPPSCDITVYGGF